MNIVHMSGRCVSCNSVAKSDGPFEGLLSQRSINAEHHLLDDRADGSHIFGKFREECTDLKQGARAAAFVKIEILHRVRVAQESRDEAAQHK